jgi:hypothetical protein
MRIAALTLTLALVSPALADPVCTQSVSLNAREVAPCTGILWSPDRTRQCLKCERERLPACHAQRQRDNEVCAANIDDLQARLLQQPGAAPTASKAAIWAAGGVVVGALIGVLIAENL